MTKPSNVQVSGPLLPFVDGFIEDLARRGYTPLSAANQVRVLAHLSRWMTARGLAVGALTQTRTLDFLQARRQAGYTCWRSERGLAPLLSFLRSTGVIPDVIVPSIEGQVEELLDAYQNYLVSERGLVEATVRRSVSTAHWFLTTCDDIDATQIKSLTALTIQAFVVRECSSRKVGSAQLLVSALRCFLRFLFLSGRVESNFSAAVPSVAGSRRNSLPKGVDKAIVDKLLASCDKRSNVGKRDFAILTLLARLGLRAGEVAALNLDDIDWRAGEITVRGKGNSVERLPLPTDVGGALVDYLRRRRQSDHRNVFLCARAPHGPMGRPAITAVVYDACRRAGIAPFGPHRLRHSLATDMLRFGSSLREVGQVLRHRSVETTAIYAKVDVEALRCLALPWPGDAQ